MIDFYTTAWMLVLFRRTKASKQVSYKSSVPYLESSTVLQLVHPHICVSLYHRSTPFAFKVTATNQNLFVFLHIKRDDIIICNVPYSLLRLHCKTEHSSGCFFPVFVHVDAFCLGSSLDWNNFHCSPRVRISHPQFLHELHSYFTCISTPSILIKNRNT